MSKTPELLPCPFCGGEANMNRLIERVPNIQVACLNCRAGFYRTLTNETEMTELWNTRVYPAEVQAAIERDTPKKLKRGDPILCEGDEFICQNCEGHVRKSLLKGNCCYNCGQRLDWSEE